jgi:hypothetical protein
MAKVYTTVPDKASGDLFTETMWDVSIRDNLNNLMSPPMCLVGASASSVPTATLTTISYATEILDTDAMHSTVTNTSRLTVSTVGLYILSAYALWQGNATGRRRSEGYLTGSGSPAIVNEANAGTSGSVSTSVGFGWLWDAANTNYAEHKVTQTSGVTLNTDTRFSAVWCGRKI